MWKILGFVLKYTRHHCPRSQEGRREREGGEKRQREWKEGVEERSRGQIEVLREERLLTGGRGGPRKKGRGERLRPERDLSEIILTAGLNRRSDRRRNGGEKKAENGEKRKRMTELLKINLASLSEGAEEGNASNRKHHRIKTLRPNRCTVALKEETHSNEVLKVTGRRLNSQTSSLEQTAEIKCSRVIAVLTP